MPELRFFDAGTAVGSDLPEVGHGQQMAALGDLLRNRSDSECPASDLTSGDAGIMPTPTTPARLLFFDKYGREDVPLPSLRSRLPRGDRHRRQLEKNDHALVDPI